MKIRYYILILFFIVSTSFTYGYFVKRNEIFPYKIRDVFYLCSSRQSYWNPYISIKLISTNVKFIEMAKRMGKNYPGNMTCQCYKCQDGIGVKNIKKVCVNKGFPEPKNKAFAYMRQQRQ